MAQRTTARYAELDLSTDETIIYDRENHDAWIQGYGHPVEMLR